MVVHPSCAILPAALMAAEATRCSGSEFLTGGGGRLLGHGTSGRRFRPNHLARGFHPVSLFSIFGAAVAVAKIMGLMRDQVHGALAQCVNLAAGNLEGSRSGGRSVREGAAVRNALLAVGLARQGIPGGETVFEGEAGFYFAYAGNREGRLSHSFAGKRTADFAAITAKLGEDWVFLEVLYRIYSTAGYNIAHVDVTAALASATTSGLRTSIGSSAYLTGSRPSTRALPSRHVGPTPIRHASSPSITPPMPFSPDHSPLPKTCSNGSAKPIRKASTT